MTNRYKPALLKFLSYVDGVKYDNDSELHMEGLVDVTPELVCRFLNHQAYGDPEPSEDMRPTHRRSSTLGFTRKALSFYMPSDEPWDPVTHTGNPTRSEEVKALISRVKSFEDRQEGARPRVRRSSAVKFKESYVASDDSEDSDVLMDEDDSPSPGPIDEEDVGDYTEQRPKYGDEEDVAEVTRAREPRPASGTQRYIPMEDETEQEPPPASETQPSRFAMEETREKDVSARPASETQDSAMGNIKEAGSVQEPLPSGEDATRCEFQALRSQLAAMQDQMTQLRNEIARSRREHQLEQQRTQEMVRRLVNQLSSAGTNAVPSTAPSMALPGTPRASRTPQTPSEASYSPSASEEETIAPKKVVRRSAVARLSQRPKDLYQLWHEYQVGEDGCKPAKNFTTAERGLSKAVYSKRKVFWDIVSTMVGAGYTSDAAIEKIYEAYGRQLPVTVILRAMQKDRKQGGHPSLRV